MPNTQTLSITCASCSAEFAAPVQSIINGQDLGLKAAFVQDQLNLLDCPHCNVNIQPQPPLYYYDLGKGLAFVLVSAELGMTSSEQKQAVSELATKVVNNLPKKQRKSYLHDPKVFDSYEAITAAILEADGITQAMVETQTARANLIEEFLRVIGDGPTFTERMRSHDAELDETFFAILTTYIETAQNNGDDTRAKMFLDLRTRLSRANPPRQALIAQIDAKLGLVMIQDQSDLLEKLIRAQNKAERKALIAAGFDLMDNSFFKKFTDRLEEASGEHDLAVEKMLKQLRSEIFELKEAHEQESKLALEKAEALFKELIQSTTPDQVLKQKIDQVSETFFFVLGTNIAKARQRGQEGPAQALEMIGRAATGLLQERQGAAQAR